MGKLTARKVETAKPGKYGDGGGLQLAVASTGATPYAVVSGAPSLDERCRLAGDEAPANLRWVMMHLLEETARHAGHADILRELIDGETGR